MMKKFPGIYLILFCKLWNPGFDKLWKKLFRRNKKTAYSEHEKYVCKRKGFREETSSDTQTVLCKHI